MATSWCIASSWRSLPLLIQGYGRDTCSWSAHHEHVSRPYPHHTRLLPQPFRVVQVATGKTRQDGTPDVLVLVTNRLDLDAELLAVAYRYRWAVELFFRWVLYL